MKKIIFLYGIVVIILVVLALTQAGKLGNLFSFQRTSGQATINGKTYNVTIVNTEESRRKGLAGKKGLDDNEGMLFMFPQKKRHQFWMQGMTFPIDIIFINDDTVTDISKNAQPLDPENLNYPLFSPSQDVNYVLEVNAGEADKNNIKPGDKVQFQNLPESSE